MNTRREFVVGKIRAQPLKYFQVALNLAVNPHEGLHGPGQRFGQPDLGAIYSVTIKRCSGSDTTPEPALNRNFRLDCEVRQIVAQKAAGVQLDPVRTSVAACYRHRVFHVGRFREYDIHHRQYATPHLVGEGSAATSVVSLL